MIWLIRIGPALVTTAMVLLFARQLLPLPLSIQFTAASIGMLVLSFFHTGINVWAARREGRTPPRGTRRNLSGHGLMVTGALIRGWAFASREMWLLLPALVRLWFGDDFLTEACKTAPCKRPQAPRNEARPPSPSEESLMHALARKRASDPLIG